jgi:ferrous iron transport protein A
MRFADLKKGMRARITQVDSNVDGVGRLMEMGLTPGAEFTVVKVAPLGDPVEIAIRGYRLCLRKAESDGIELEVVD